MINTITVQTTGLFSHCSTIATPLDSISKTGAPPRLATPSPINDLSKLSPADQRPHPSPCFTADMVSVLPNAATCACVSIHDLLAQC